MERVLFDLVGVMIRVWWLELIVFYVLVCVFVGFGNVFENYLCVVGEKCLRVDIICLFLLEFLMFV